MQIRIVQSVPAYPGWHCCYIIPGPTQPTIVVLPIVLWTLIEYNGQLADGSEGQIQQYRPYVANRHGGVADYMSTQMEFLVLCHPGEEVTRVSQGAFEHWVQGRAALEEAKRQAAERDAEAKKTAADAESAKKPMN